MKIPLKRPLPVREDRIEGHDILVQVEPFAAQALIDLLVAQKYQIDPNWTRIVTVFNYFDQFAYRWISRKLPLREGRLHWTVAYHEAFHCLTALKFGAGLRGRPKMTLLNECMPQALDLYFFARLAQASGRGLFELTDTTIRDNAKELGVSFHGDVRRMMKDPFKVMKETSVESFEFHWKLFQSLRRLRQSPEEFTREFLHELKRKKNIVFVAQADVSNTILYLVTNCGFKSTKEDLRAADKCLDTFESSRNLDDLLRKFGIEDFIHKKRRAHG